MNDIKVKGGKGWDMFESEREERCVRYWECGYVLLALGREERKRSIGRQRGFVLSRSWIQSLRIKISELVFALTTRD